MKGPLPSHKKVLIISSEFPPNTGGIGNHAFHIAQWLSTQQYQVTVLADIADYSNSAINNFSSTLPFTLIPVLRKEFVVFTYASRMVKALQLAAKSDVIICSGKFSLWLMMAIGICFAGKKRIAVVHGSELDLKQAWAKKLTTTALGYANAIISVSHYTKQFIPAALAHKKPVYIIPNGINIKDFNGLTGKEKTTDATLQLITIGSVSERKGQLNVIQALPALLQHFPNLQYHIVGKPVMQAMLGKTINALHLKPYVVFHGIMEQQQMLQLLAQCHIKLMLSNHTSSGDFEGFGIAILEANALGIPAIGSSKSGIADAIKNGETGILVMPADIAAITEATRQIINNYAAFSTAALEWAKQHDWQLIIQQYIAIIEGN